MIPGKIVANDVEHGKMLIDFEKGYIQQKVARSDSQEVRWVKNVDCLPAKDGVAQIGGRYEY